MSCNQFLAAPILEHIRYIEHELHVKYSDFQCQFLASADSNLC